MRYRQRGELALRGANLTVQRGDRLLLEGVLATMLLRLMIIDLSAANKT